MRITPEILQKVKTDYEGKLYRFNWWASCKTMFIMNIDLHPTKEFMVIVTWVNVEELTSYEWNESLESLERIFKPAQLCTLR